MLGGEAPPRTVGTRTLVILGLVILGGFLFDQWYHGRL